MKETPASITRNANCYALLVVIVLGLIAMTGCGNTSAQTPSQSKCEQCDVNRARADALVDLLAQERLRNDQQRASMNEQIIKAINAQASDDKILADRMMALELQLQTEFETPEQ